MTTPSTNKCCEKCEPRLFTREWCRDEECDCHPKDDYKPTVPSVCDVRVQTAEGVNKGGGAYVVVANAMRLACSLGYLKIRFPRNKTTTRKGQTK